MRTKGAPYIPSTCEQTPANKAAMLTKVEQDRAAGQVQRWQAGDTVFADGHPAKVITPLFSSLYGWYYEVESAEGVRAKLVAARLKKVPNAPKPKRVHKKKVKS